MRYFNNLV